MKKRLYRFFVWSAGSDQDILDRCGRSEHIKHAGYGGLVLVPAILGVFSMIYAISTLTDRWYIYTAAGLTWGVIVFIFDRFIVSTFRKSDSPRKDILSFLFASRLLFSIGIGIVVSHPTVLLVFDDSLRQELLRMKAEGEQEIVAKFESDMQVVRSRDSVLNQQVADRLAERRCKETLLLFEMSGKDTTLSCGTTSGMLQYGPRAREIKEEISYLNQEIKEMQAQNAAKIEANRAEIDKITKEKELKYTTFQDEFSTNYLAREVALERLMQREEGGGTVRGTMWFLILFFILIDILPVSFKAATKPGLYDRILEKDGAFDPESTPAFERRQEDKVRKQIAESLTDQRLKDVQELATGWKGSYPALRTEMETRVNQAIPYHFGSAVPKENRVSPPWQGLGISLLRNALFAVIQSGLLFLLTRDELFMGWFVLLLFVLNTAVGYLLVKMSTLKKV